MTVIILLLLSAALSSCYGLEGCMLANSSYAEVCPVQDKAPIHLGKEVLLEPEGKVVGCWVPKSGSRVLVSIFNSLTTDCTMQPFQNCPKGTQNCSEMGQCRGITIQQAYKNKDYLRITAVRDPLMRFISGYLDKLHDAKSPQSMIDFLDIYGGYEISFEEYLQRGNLENTPLNLLRAFPTDSTGAYDISRGINPHFHPQTDVCKLSRIRYDVYIDANTDILPSLMYVDLMKKNVRDTRIHDMASYMLNSGNHILDTSSANKHAMHANTAVCYIADRKVIFELVKTLYQRDYEILDIVKQTVITDIDQYCAELDSNA